MKKDKFRLILLAFVTIALLATISLYGFMMVSNNEVNTGSLIAFVIPLLIIVFMTFFIVRRYKDVRRGVPFEDERSKKVMTNAAARSFYISLYWLLAISWFESVFAGMFDLERLDASQTVGGGVAGMAVIFFTSWFYFNRKGRLV